MKNRIPVHKQGLNENNIFNSADGYDRTLLMHAAASGYPTACRILLRRGADPNLQAIDGATAAMYASYNGHTRIVKTLLKEGANPKLKDNESKTALDHAVNPDIKNLLTE